MTQKDFWRNSTIAVLGGGSWGSVLANLAAPNCRDVRLWVRSEEHARQINGTRTNPDYVPGMQIHERIHAMTDLGRVFEGGVQAVIWALPSSAAREQGKNVARHLTGEEIILHATKGIEAGSLKRISQILAEELPCARIGVISGPNLANEVAKSEPAATVVASHFEEALDAGVALLAGPRFRIYSCRDVIGVEWAGTLKNTLAIASGALDALGFGWNARSMLITRGLAEMVRFGDAMGAETSTFLGLAGIGDLLATCASPLSRNFRVGQALARGEPIEQILANLGATAEGVRTTRTVWEFARRHEIEMPITEAVFQLLEGKVKLADVMNRLMTRPAVAEGE